MVKRPRSRKQLYRAEALLALDEGQPIEAVARKFRVGVERVEHWVSGFEKLRLAFLAEPKAAGSRTTSRIGMMPPGRRMRAARLRDDPAQAGRWGGRT